MRTADPSTTYRERAAHFGGQAAALARRERLIGWVRLAAFAVGLAVLVQMELRGGSALGVFVVSVAAAVFLVLVVVHDRLRSSCAEAEALENVNREGIERLARNFRTLPPLPPSPVGVDHAYADDLDVLGPAGLERLAGPPATAAGRVRLRDWLLAPAPPVEIRERQEAVAELAPQLDLRDAFAAAGRLGGQKTMREEARFQDWAAGDSSLPGRRLLFALAWTLPPLTLLLLALRLGGVFDRPLWLIPLLVQATLGLLLAGRVDQAFSQAFPSSAMFRGAAGLFRLIEERDPQASLLRRLRTELANSGEPAHRAFRSLERLMELAENRRSGFGFLLQLATLWQFHVLSRLDAWRRRHGAFVPRWFDVLATADALAALAAIRHDHPAWSFPVLAQDGPPRLAGRALGHPLIPPDKRVTNDVSLPAPGRFLLVTGSNMSGKSTLLRAIGANAVLAQAGAPVCATWFELTPCRLWTSMRVQDSLERGVSRFLAELSRIRTIVGAAPEPGSGEAPLLYLLDEILQGTNTAERRIAARSVLLHLLERRAFGAITTHDLTLASAPDLEQRAVPVHLREHVERGADGVRMSFDYVVRPGVATSTNALVLLEMMGLEVAEGDA